MRVSVKDANYVRTGVQRSRRRQRSTGSLITATHRLLGVWAAEGNQNLQRIFDLSERRWLHYLEAAKGSGTVENVIF